MTAEATILGRVPTFERRLENGLIVLVREDHSAPVVAIVTHVRAGYFNEPDRLVGISHVLEHMYFKGTERRGAGELARETKAAGGFLNAGTIYDYTSYYTVLPSSALELGLDIQSDALRHSEIDEEELRRELLVIIQEAKRKLDNPAAVATESLYEELFDVHRFRRWRIGTEEVLRRLRRADVWEYYRNLYRPANIVLAIAGDVDPDRTFRLVERYYGDMPAGAAVKEASPPEPPRRGFRFREAAGDIVQTHTEWGWRTPGSLHPDTPALDLLAVVLGQGRASRLYRGVRERGLVTGVHAYNYTPTEIGVFGVSAEHPAGDTLESLEATWREIDAVRRDGVRPADVERARNLLEARMVRRLETAEGQANLLAEWQALGDWRLAERYHARVLSTGADELRRVARDYLDLELATLLVYRPAAEPPVGRSAPALAEALTGTADSARGVAETRSDPAVDAPSGPPDPARPAARRAVEDEVHLFGLPRGGTLCVKPRRASPLVSIAFYWRGGLLHETEAIAGATNLMARASIKGTAGRSAARLAEETEWLGGAIAPVVAPDLVSWTLSVPGRHLERALELLADAVLRPAFPEAEVARERKVALTNLEQLRDDMVRYPMRLFFERAFSGHPYGLGTAAAESSIRRITAGELADWHRRRILQAEPLVLVVGDADPDATAALVVRELAGSALDPAAAAPPPAAPAAWPDGPHEEAEHRAKAQTAMVLGFPGPARNDSDVFAAQLLSNVLSGLGGRFFEELRSRRSLAYTVAAFPVSRWLAGAFLAYIATSPEREDEARRGLIDGFERIAAERIAEHELERAKRYTIGAWKIRSQTNGAQLGDLADALLLGGGLRELREYEAMLHGVTAIEIREMVARRFDPNRLVEGIVRGDGGSR